MPVLPTSATTQTIADVCGRLARWETGRHRTAVATNMPRRSGIRAHGAPENAARTPARAPPPTATDAQTSRRSRRSATDTPRPTSRDATKMGRPIQRATTFVWLTARTAAARRARAANQRGNVTRRSVVCELRRDSTTAANVSWPTNVATMIATAMTPFSARVNTRDEIESVAAGITASETPPARVTADIAALLTRLEGAGRVMWVGIRWASELCSRRRVSAGM